MKPKPSTKAGLREEIERILGFEPTKMVSRARVGIHEVNQLESLIKNYLERVQLEEKKTQGRKMPVWRKGNKCANCGKDISNRDRRASYCLDCAGKVNREEQGGAYRIKGYNQAVREQRKRIKEVIG